MKVFLNILVIVLFTAGPLVAQQIIDPPCTALSVSYPTYIVSGRVPIPVSVEVVGAKQVVGMERANQLSYQWTASHGTIMSGQGTSNILVVPVNKGISEIALNVRIIGGDPTCETERSFSIKVDADCVSPKKIDEYGDVPFADESAHLDALVRQLAASDVIYILVYAGRNSCLWDEAKSRAIRAREYLIQHHGIQSDRIVVADNGYRNHLTIELLVGRRGSCAPLPTWTILVSDVRLSGFCREKYKSRGESIERPNDSPHLGYQTKEDSSVSIKQLRKSPALALIDGTSLSLTTYPWRDFMPGPSTADGSPMMVVLRIATAEKKPFPNDVKIDRAWVLFDEQVWEASDFRNRTKSEPRSDEGWVRCSTAPVCEVTARGGPKWGPGVYVDVVVRLIDSKGQYHFIQAPKQLVLRSD